MVSCFVKRMTSETDTGLESLVHTIITRCEPTEPPYRYEIGGGTTGDTIEKIWILYSIVSSLLVPIEKENTYLFFLCSFY